MDPGSKPGRGKPIILPLNSNTLNPRAAQGHTKPSCVTWLRGLDNVRRSWNGGVLHVKAGMLPYSCLSDMRVALRLSSGQACRTHANMMQSTDMRVPQQWTVNRDHAVNRAGWWNHVRQTPRYIKDPVQPGQHHLFLSSTAINKILHRKQNEFIDFTSVLKRNIIRKYFVAYLN